MSKTIANISVDDFHVLPNESRAETAKRYNVSIRTISRLVKACKEAGINYETENNKPSKAKQKRLEATTKVTTAKQKRNANTFDLTVAKKATKPAAKKPTAKKETKKETKKEANKDKVDYQYVVTDKSAQILATTGDNRIFVRDIDDINEIKNIIDIIASGKTEKLAKYFIGEHLVNWSTEVNGVKISINERDIRIGRTTLTRELISAIMQKSNNDISARKFLVNLAKNPDADVINHLGDFLRHNHMEVDNNGHIIAYKAVSHEFKDLYTKSIDNSIGKTVKMKRKDVDPNPRQVCSHGLHVGSKEYAYEFGTGGDIIVKVKVHPKHVVAVPHDYIGQKCRVCEYTILEQDGVVPKK